MPHDDNNVSHAVGHAIGIGVLVALIGFAFGARAARVFVVLVLIAGGLCFAGLMFLVITDRI